MFLHKIDNVVDRFASFLYNAAINQSSDKESTKRRVVRNKQKKKGKKPWIDEECNIKYRHIKSLSRTLRDNPWDKNLPKLIV